MTIQRAAQRVLDLALKDLREVLRDRRTLVLQWLLPLVCTVLLGWLLGSPAHRQAPLSIGVVAGGDALLGSQLAALLRAAPPSLPVELPSPGAAEAAVRSGKLAGAIVLPADFAQGLREGHAPQPSVLADPSDPRAAAVQRAAAEAIFGVLSAAEAARLELRVIEPPAGDRAALWDATASGALALWTAAKPRLRIEPAPGSSAEPENAFAQTSPGMLVMFAIFGLASSATLIVIERNTRALERLLTTSMRRFEILTGHLLALASPVLAQGALLISFGQLVLGVRYGQQPLAVLAVLAALALWVASLGLLIGVAARGHEQAVLLSTVSMIVFSALGGAWFPLQAAGGWFARAGAVTPVAQAMQGFHAIVSEGLGFAAVVPRLAALVGYAALCFLLALWRFRA